MTDKEALQNEIQASGISVVFLAKEIGITREGVDSLKL